MLQEVFIALFIPSLPSSSPTPCAPGAEPETQSDSFALLGPHISAGREVMCTPITRTALGLLLLPLTPLLPHPPHPHFFFKPENSFPWEMYQDGLRKHSDFCSLGRQAKILSAPAPPLAALHTGNTPAGDILILC